MLLASVLLTKCCRVYYYLTSVCTHLFSSINHVSHIFVYCLIAKDPRKMLRMLSYNSCDSDTQICSLILSETGMHR